MKARKLIWYICCATVLILSILAFSPLVIPQGVSKPEFLGMPYTLWMGMLVSILLVVMTFIGTKVHPGTED